MVNKWLSEFVWGRRERFLQKCKSWPPAGTLKGVYNDWPEICWCILILLDVLLDVGTFVLFLVTSPF